MELLDVIKRPVITEKSMLAMDEKKYTFEVDTRANKTLVKQAVESGQFPHQEDTHQHGRDSS